jgi:filamentous hemagglutinin
MVVKTPDVNALLNRQADMMSAAAAAGQAVAQRIGDYAQSKYDEAKANHDQAGMDVWKDGGPARAEMQAAGAAMVAGLGGGAGTAVAGAVGAGAASLAAGKLSGLSDAIAGASPTRNAEMDKALGNIVANAVATGAGYVAGNAGAFEAGNVDLYNRSLHEDSKAKEQSLAKQLADGSGGKYTPEQIEDQMAQMNLTVNGQTESGGVRVATGTQPQDGTGWQSYGVNKAGQQVWAQSLGPGDPDLQSYIVNGAQGSGLAYQATTTGSNPGLVRAPDFVNFQVDYFVGSAWGTFTRDGNSFFGGGLNLGVPNAVGAGVGISAGYLNTAQVSPGQTNNFAGGYAGGGSALYSGFGGGVMVSPGNGTATVIGIGAGVNVGKTDNPISIGWGFSVDQGKTGIRW